MSDSDGELTIEPMKFESILQANVPKGRGRQAQGDHLPAVE